jgi:branched-chain amino acid transport system substrate-binding protein
MRISKRWLRLLALLFAFALVAAACGDSDDNGGADAGDETPADDTTADGGDEGGSETDDDIQDAINATTTTAADAAAAPATFEELEAVWAADRAAIVDMLLAGIDAGDYGLGDDNILRGPGGLEVDLNECPEDWSDTGGITDDTIRLGQSFVRSGTLAAYVNLSVGMEKWYEYVSSQGGIEGKTIEFITKDDGYVAAQTIEFVDELIESEDVFSIHTGGSPNTLAVYQKLNDECIPNPFVATGHPAWGDPVNHPWTLGSYLAYNTEAVVWGNWIQSNLADELPVKVAGMAIDNDFGLSYSDAFQEWADEHPDVVSEFVVVRHDPAAPTVSNEVTTIAAADPDVFISMTAGNACLLAIQEVGNSGLLEDLSAAFTPQVCKGIEAFMAPAGEFADGWLIVGGGRKDISDPIFADDVFISWLNDYLRSEGLDPSVSLLGDGIFYSWPNVESMRIAAELPGGLTRSNFLLAAHSLDIKHPMLQDGIKFAVNGNEDSFYTEGTDISRYDAEGKTWIQEGNVIDLNGSSPNCAWDAAAASCG